jgi:hypothetical protein
MSARSFHTLVDHSKPMPCSRRHNVETAGVRPIYTTLTKANTKETVQGYFGACGTAWDSYLHHHGNEFNRIWGTPIATQEPDGSWVIRCDVYVGARVGYGGTPVVTTTSVGAQAKAGRFGSWTVCTDQLPTAKTPLVDCARPHSYEGVPEVQTLIAYQGVYPSPAQLRSRGNAVCRRAVAHRRDADRLAVGGFWMSKHRWNQNGRRSEILGECYFYRADRAKLPPVR